jgi:radical SAM protein with 4Fe4S-binding SPASM domain
LLTQAKTLQKSQFPPPKTVWIEPTNACNLKCSWCFQANGAMTRPLGMMTFETFKRVISEIEPFKPQINMHLAGESFLHKELIQMVEHAKKHGLTVAMTTNGTLLRKNDFAILDSGIDFINVSLAGVNSEDYLRVRGMKNFDEVKKTVEDLGAAKVGRRSSAEIQVNATETEQNRGGVAEFKNKFGSMSGIQGVLVRSLMDWQGTVDVSGMKVKSGVVPGLKRFVKSHRRLLKTYVVAKSARNLVATRGAKLRNRTLCDAPYASAGILWDGTVVPCCLDYNGTIPLGNINEKSFMEIWNDEPINNLRKMLKSVEATRAHPTCGPCRGL